MNCHPQKTYCICLLKAKGEDEEERVMLETRAIKAGGIFADFANFNISKAQQQSVS